MMNNGLDKLFTLYVPTKIIFGINAVGRLPDELRRLKAKNVFIVTDEKLVKIGLLDRIMNCMRKERVNVQIFDRITVEPTTEILREAIKIVREGNFNLVMGVGGGSCLDSAKVCAALATNPGDVKLYYSFSEDKLKEKPLPMILIPTTAGTGSEVDNGAVIIDEGYKTVIVSDKLFPEVAIVDPMMMLSLPPKQTAYSGMDALSHAIEGLISNQVFPLIDAVALDAVRLISGNLRKAYYDGGNLKARWNMSLAAMLCGFLQSIPGFTGSYLGHCIAELVGPKYNIHHGLACAIVLPQIMKFNLPVAIERLALIGVAMNEEIAKLSKRRAAVEAIRAIFDLMEDLELPLGLKDLGVPKDDIQIMSGLILNQRQYEYSLPSFVPRKLTHENIARLLEDVWNGTRI